MPEARADGPLAPAGRIARRLGDAAVTRLSLAAVELECHGDHLARQALGLAWTLFLAGVGIVLAVTAALLACPPAWRAALAGALAAGFLGGAAWLARAGRRRAAATPPLLADTLDALRRDAALWRGDAGDGS